MCRVLFLHFHVQVLFGAGVAHTMHSVRVVLVQGLLTVFGASVFLETINPEHKKKWVLVGTGRYTVLAKHHGGSPVMFHSEIVIFHISIVIFHISGGVG